MSETAIFEAARAAAVAALPGVKDWSDNPSDPMPGKLDAIVVILSRDGAVASAMGSGQEEVQLTLEVEVFGQFGPNDSGRADMRAKAETVLAAILAAAALEALVDHLHCQTLDVDLAKGETRLARAAITFSIEATI